MNDHDAGVRGWLVLGQRLFLSGGFAETANSSEAEEQACSGETIGGGFRDRNGRGPLGVVKLHGDPIAGCGQVGIGIQLFDAGDPGVDIEVRRRRRQAGRDGERRLGPADRAWGKD